MNRREKARREQRRAMLVMAQVLALLPLSCLYLVALFRAMEAAL